MKIFKKLDIVIIIFLIIISFTPYFISAKALNKNYSSTYANIKVSGNLYKTINLSSIKNDEKIVINTDKGTNTILINKSGIKMIHADCKDELCVKQGTINKVTESLVCLPHELIIEIKGDESTNDDDIILSH